MKFLEKGQKADQCLPGTGGKSRDWLQMDTKRDLGGDGRVLKLDCGDTFPAVKIS